MDSSSRRDFLKGKAALRAAEQLFDRADVGDASPAPQAEPDYYLLKYSRRAMACNFEIWFNAGQYREAGEAAIAALDLVEALEAQLTVFRESSELSQINRRAFGEPIEIEPHLFRLLSQCVELWSLTSGAFDITAGALSELWGFKRREGRIPDQAAITATLARIGSQHVSLDAVTRSVEFERPGIEINLGAIGKGYALDRCAELFAANNLGDFLIHGGNSSVLARGARAADRAAGWSVGVRNPWRPQQYLGEIQLRDKALSTSGSGTQFFEHAGRRFGHILDPRTGWPASGVLSVTAIAATAAEAEALSTACYVLGPSCTDQLLAQQRQYGCLMICPGTEAGALEMHSWNLQEGEWMAKQAP